MPTTLPKNLEEYLFLSGHSERVLKYAVEIAKEIGYENMEDLKMGAILHDIGKILIPHKILLKPGKLTKNELKLVRTHPVRGIELLKNPEKLSEEELENVLKYFDRSVEELKKFGKNQTILKCVYTHHESYDGTGYPQGLKENSIPIEGRILKIADVFDALTSDRPYRKALPPDKALNEMLKEKEKFDPKLLQIFIKSVYPRVEKEIFNRIEKSF